MNNPIKDYDWGSSTLMNEILGIENEGGTKQAEMWMGNHPNGRSKVVLNGRLSTINHLINSASSSILGENVTKLPFLFKVLAAEKALSIQVHPSKLKAEKGFKEEELFKIDLNAPDRCFKDDNHKPELVYALSEYHALNGFKGFVEVLHTFSIMDIPVIRNIVLSAFTHQGEKGLKILFEGVLSLSQDEQSIAVAHLLDHASKNQDNSVFKLICELSVQYPDDIGLFAPIFLNYIVLKRGEAMYLGAGTPHAYIRGIGLEIMANSDNVLRAGLTNKHIDVKTLIDCTDFKETKLEDLLTVPFKDIGNNHYFVPVRDFKFSIMDQPAGIKNNIKGAEILFCIEEPAMIQHVNGESILLKAGESIFIPAYAHQYKVTSIGSVARAFY